MAIQELAASVVKLMGLIKKGNANSQEALDMRVSIASLYEQLPERDKEMYKSKLTLQIASNIHSESTIRRRRFRR